MGSVVLDSCTLANQELIQSSLNEVIHEYFNWTTSVDVPDQGDCNDDSCSSDSDSACLESDAFSEHQDNCLDLTETDGDELETIRNFLKAGCGCQFGPKAHHCSSTISYSEALECRTNCLQLSKEELDLIVLSHLQCHLRRKEVGGRKRKRYVCNFFFSGQQICKTTYLFLHAVGRDNPPCSLLGRMHYSYDYAQQVHYPSNPLQPGPIYFKTPWKCSIFGVCCEAIPHQVNFLVDEAVLTGKGANSTISLVHYFFKNFGLGETNAYIHADNCAGQNKNNYFLWYYAWRVIVGLHWSILYSFLVAGHTKFSPDWCFGLAKQAVRKTFISDLFELAHAIDNSTVTGVNVSQLCGLHDGSVLVPTYDWASFLDKYFKKLPGVKGYHHFRFSNDSPGRVFCKRYVDSEEVQFDLLRDPSKLPPCTLPPIINPAGLDLERRSYLYKEIRQFCKPNSADLVAPKP